MRRSGDEFWSLSYREILACVDHYRDEQADAVVPFGVVAATIRNVNRSKESDKVWGPEDFFKRRASQVPAMDPRDPLLQVRPLEAVRDDFRKWHAVDGTN